MEEGSDQKSVTAASFGERADGYRTSTTHGEGADLELLASWCTGAQWALDIATGAGHTAGALRDAGIPNVIASDAALAMVTTSVDSFPGLTGVVADAERLPFAPDTFDAVTCRIAPHHFPDPETFVMEVHRVVRPGGTFALEDNVAPEDDALESFLNRLETMRDPTHIASYRTSTWHQWLEDAGFSIEHTTHLMTRIPFTEWVNRSSALTSEDKQRVQQYLVDAPERMVEFFDIQFEDEAVHSFGSLKALIPAKKHRTGTD